MLFAWHWAALVANQTDQKKRETVEYTACKEWVRKNRRDSEAEGWKNGCCTQTCANSLIYIVLLFKHTGWMEAHCMGIFGVDIGRSIQTRVPSAFSKASFSPFPSALNPVNIWMILLIYCIIVLHSLNDFFTWTTALRFHFFDSTWIT